MHSSFIAALLITLASVTVALDLSHAGTAPVDVEPRFFNLINDFYATVIHPPLNHIVTNMALLGAQVLAGISQVGIPAPGRRSLDLSDTRAQQFVDILWEKTVKPHLARALSAFSSLAAHVLARLGEQTATLNKRDLTEAEARNFFNDLWNNAIRPPVENALTDASLMLAQLLAGIGVNGVSLGKRDLTEAEARNFFNDLWNNAIRPPVENALTDASLMLAQLLAGIGVNGVSLGKREALSLSEREDELRGLFDSFGQTVLTGLQSVWTNIIKTPLEGALQSGALMGAQVLAGLGVNGVSLG